MLTGHKIGGWLCAECGVTNIADEGVIPSLELVDNAPSIVLTAKDGHREVITLGYENLARLTLQGLHLYQHRPD